MPRPLYCSVDMVRAELPIDLPTGAFENDDVERRIALQSGYIDDYLSGQYEVPFRDFPQTPASIQLACILLVVHYSYIISGVPTEKEDPRQSLWGRAHDILDKIRSREIILTDNDGDPLTNPVRSTLPLGLGAARGQASMTAQAFALGPMRGRWYSGMVGGGYAGGYPIQGDDGWEEPR